MQLNKDGNNLRRTIFFAYIFFSFIWIVNLTYRVKHIESIINERTPYVQKLLEMDSRIVQMEGDIDRILKHHVELYEELKNEQK